MSAPTAPGPSPGLLFVTYSRIEPTAQIGVLKRCLRLMPHLASDYRIDLLNFGPLPEGDPLLESLRDRITVHAEPEEPLAAGLQELLGELDPRSVVLGEVPLHGAMRRTEEAAATLDLPVTVIDNYYGRIFAEAMLSERPSVASWLLLGLSEEGASHRSSPGLEVAPPLVRFPPGFGDGERDRVSILGYDAETLQGGVRLLRMLPAGERVELFLSSESQGSAAGRELDRARPGLTVRTAPSEDELFGALARSRLVFCKAGYQQVVESLVLGAAVVCQTCGGGIYDELVADHLRPYLRIVDADFGRADRRDDLAEWIARPPVTEWAGVVDEVPDPAAHAAAALARLVGG